jgi:hypothetical protein
VGVIGHEGGAGLRAGVDDAPPRPPQTCSGSVGRADPPKMNRGGFRGGAAGKRTRTLSQACSRKSLDTARQFMQCSRRQRLGALPGGLPAVARPSSGLRGPTHVGRDRTVKRMTLEEIGRRGPLVVDDAASHRRSPPRRARRSRMGSTNDRGDGLPPEAGARPRRRCTRGGVRSSSSVRPAAPTRSPEGVIVMAPSPTSTR